MKLGIITDIHEHVEHLRAALDRLRREGVDQIVFVGDVFEMGVRIEECCRLLAEAHVIGVWGNHDFGLCYHVPDIIRRRYPAAVIDYMTSLRPRLEIGGCHFCHIEPWLDATDVSDLWNCEGPPDHPKKLRQIFKAVPHQFLFAGHFHRWLLARPTAFVDWPGDAPIRLDQGRYFIVVDALFDGCFATFDTNTLELVPFCESDLSLGPQSIV